jgi:hypothetical protein
LIIFGIQQRSDYYRSEGERHAEVENQQLDRYVSQNLQQQGSKVSEWPEPATTRVTSERVKRLSQNMLKETEEKHDKLFSD